MKRNNEYNNNDFIVVNKSGGDIETVEKNKVVSLLKKEAGKVTKDDMCDASKLKSARNKLMLEAELLRETISNLKRFLLIQRYQDKIEINRDECLVYKDIDNAELWIDRETQEIVKVKFGFDEDVK